MGSNTAIRFLLYVKVLIMIKRNYTMSEILNWYTLNESISLCRQGKMWKDSMIDAVSWSDFYICELLEQLSSGMIIISDFWHSIIYERGKERLLCSLKVMDRVEQKAINRNFLLPAFVPSLMRDNVASVKIFKVLALKKSLNCNMLLLSVI